MKAPHPLFPLYQRWETLTVTEGHAIAAGNWPEVERCQREKELLQQEITRCSAESGAGKPSPELQQVLSALMAREKDNQDLLAAQLQAAELQRTGWSAASRHLRRIGDAYGSRQNARWQSYS